MKKKITKKRIIITTVLFLLSQLLLIYLLFFFNGHGLRASAQQINSNGIIKVGISTQNFDRLEYEKVSVTSEGQLLLTDKNTGKNLSTIEPFRLVNFFIKDDKINVTNQCGKLIAKTVDSSIIISSLSGFPIEIAGLKRANKPAKYKGSIEIIKSNPKRSLLSVVNVLPLEEYLKGVVPNEMPVYFGLEALKAQTVAARNYAIRPRVFSAKPYDICDSVQCQVYFGANTESALSNKAIEETKGLAAIYDGTPILALYSSTAGGYTESYENAFTYPNTNEFVKSVPYLKGKPDIDGLASLANEKDAYDFYTSAPETFDVNSSYYRWTRSWSKSELEDLLSINLLKLSKTGLVTPKFNEGDKVIGLAGFQVLERGVSGKVKLLKIVTENAEWTVKKELMIRRLFEKSGKMLPSANIVFSNQYDEQGRFIGVLSNGGGLGHGVGMSQFGAGYLSSLGTSFDKILKHYYDGISLGTIPVFITSDMCTPIFNEFYSSSPKLRLNIVNNNKAEHLILSVNGTLLEIPDLKKKNNLVKVNLDKFAIKGNNVIAYYPLERSDSGKKIKVWFEIIEADNN